jgi:eukaryotic-like serine/threonine-protein kinase
MMADLSWFQEVDKFLSLILKSKLLGQTELENAWQEFEDQISRLAVEPELQSLCTFMTSTDRLTRWQCDRLNEGRWKGFFLDEYKLVDWLEADEDFSYYLAEEVATKRQVKLKIAPKSRSRPIDGKPYYEVQEL